MEWLKFEQSEEEDNAAYGAAKEDDDSRSGASLHAADIGRIDVHNAV